MSISMVILSEFKTMPADIILLEIEITRIHAQCLYMWKNRADRKELAVRIGYCRFVCSRLRGEAQIWMHAAFRYLIALQNIACIPIVYVLAPLKSL